MITLITVFGIVIGVCIFAAMAAAPYCEPAERKAANAAERERARNN